MELKTKLGICGYCGYEYTSSEAGALAQHGFRISDGAGQWIGFRSGPCPCRIAVEISSKGIEMLISDLTRHIERYEARLIWLRSRPETIPLPSYLWKNRRVREEPISAEDPRYEKSLNYEIEKAEYEVKLATQSRTTAEERLRLWKAGTLRDRPKVKPESRYVLRDKYGPGSYVRAGSGCRAFGVWDRTTGTFAIAPNLQRFAAVNEVARLRAEEEVAK